MALGSGEQQSGGKVIDQDQRQVVAVEGPGGAPISVTDTGGSTDVTDRSARVLGHVVVDSAPASSSDVSDRSGRLLGHVTVDSAPTTAVTGTFFQSTQPVSAVSLPLPSGAATDSTLTNGNLRVGGTVSVTGTFFQATQPISAVSLPLPTGAATDASLTNGNLRVGGTTAVSAASLPLPSGAAQDGTDGAAPPTIPGTGIRGWLRSIYDKLNGTLAVSMATNTPDVTDRAARLLGHVTVDSAPTTAVTGTFFQSTQPVSLATNTPDVTDRAARLLGHVTVDSAPSTAVTGTVTANQGTAAATASAWPLKVTDGSNTATVKAASTAAAAGDSSLAVALHPTSPLPAGTNALGSVQVSGGTASPNFVRTTDEPRQVFYDPFDGTSVDTTNRWTSLSGGGGVSPAVSAGNLTLGTGTTTAGYSTLGSQQSFMLPIPGWMGFSSVIKLENPVTANTYRFWGAGTIPTSPTVAAPLTDAVGFELYTDGKLYAVSYAAGVRTVIQDMSTATGNGKQPADANSHRYIVYVRTDASYWYIDGLLVSQLAATSSFQGPNTQTLPARLLAIAGTSPSPSGVLTSAGTAVWDTAKNASQISDGTFPWRKATVSSLGRLSVDTALDATLTGGNVRVNDSLVQETLMVLRQILLTLAEGLNVDPATESDAFQIENLQGAKTG